MSRRERARCRRPSSSMRLAQGAAAVAVSARLQAELGELDEDEAAAMRADLGLSESGLETGRPRSLLAASPGRVLHRRGGQAGPVLASAPGPLRVARGRADPFATSSVASSAPRSFPGRSSSTAGGIRRRPRPRDAPPARAAIVRQVRQIARTIDRTVKCHSASSRCRRAHLQVSARTEARTRIAVGPPRRPASRCRRRRSAPCEWSPSGIRPEGRSAPVHLEPPRTRAASSRSSRS